MSKKERDELHKLMDGLDIILNNENSSEAVKEMAEYHKAAISGYLLSPLFPIGIIRNILMTGFFAIGFLAFLTPYEWLFWSFFIALAFSPRIVGKIIHVSGRIIGAVSRPS